MAGMWLNCDLLPSDFTDGHQPENEEMVRLRRENKDLQEENEIQPFLTQCVLKFMAL